VSKDDLTRKVRLVLSQGRERWQYADLAQGPARPRRGVWQQTIMAADDEDRPRKKIIHEIGQDLALLSVGELTERMELLQGEIERLKAAAASKQASRSAADKFFKA